MDPIRNESPKPKPEEKPRIRAEDLSPRLQNLKVANDAFRQFQEVSQKDLVSRMDQIFRDRESPLRGYIRSLLPYLPESILLLRTDSAGDQSGSRLYLLPQTQEVVHIWEDTDFPKIGKWPGEEDFPGWDRVREVLPGGFMDYEEATIQAKKNEYHKWEVEKNIARKVKENLSQEALEDPHAQNALETFRAFGEHVEEEIEAIKEDLGGNARSRILNLLNAIRDTYGLGDLSDQYQIDTYVFFKTGEGKLVQSFQSPLFRRLIPRYIDVNPAKWLDYAAIIAEKIFKAVPAEDKAKILSAE